MKSIEQKIVDAIIFARKAGFKFHWAPCYSELHKYIHPMEAVVLANNGNLNYTNTFNDYSNNYNQALAKLECSNAWLDSFNHGFSKTDINDRTKEVIIDMKAYKFGKDLREKLKL